MEQIKIDLVPNGVMSVAHASQFDVGRPMKFLLTDEGVTYTLAGTEVITMKLRKPDGTDDTISLVNTSSSYVEWTTVDGDLDLSGVYLAEITITSGDDVLGTANFLLKVEPDPYNGKNIRIVTVGPADICTFETTLPEPYPSVTVNVVATGGNGTPDNPNPIVGYSSANITRCGVNLYPIKISNDTFVDNASATHESSGDELVIIASSSGNSGAYSTNASDIGKLLGMLSGKVTYSFDIYVTVAGWYLIGITNVGREAKNLSTGWQRITLTGTSNRTINTLVFYNQTNTASEIRVKNFILESGSSASDYEEYNGQTYAITFGQTVYGGVLDVTRGKLRVTHKLLTLNGSEEWSTRESGVGTLYELSIYQTGKANVGVSNMYVYEQTLTQNNTFRILASGIVSVIAIHDDNRTDLATFKTFLSNNNLQIKEELTTPFDIDLTPEQIRALVGENNVFADCGQTTVEYMAEV